MNRLLPLLFVLSATMCAPAPGRGEKPRVFEGECVVVHDGDTISVLVGRKQVKVRLEGIDCPELGQDFGTRARQYTSTECFGKTVSVEPRYHDRYGRTVARVRVGGRDLSVMLVEAGLAWHYVAHSSDPELATAQLNAQKAHRGLWSMRSPTPPWQWRRTERSRKAGQRPERP